jgi:TorA maturation chaperone TorD
MTAALPAAGSALERDVLEALGRASAYRLLGAGFAYPGADRLPAIGTLARALAGGAARDLAPALERLARCADEADAAALAVEHVFLFDRGARCPPYEGAWGDAPHPAGKAALLADIAGFYAAFGMHPAGPDPDMEDHVAAECEFVSALLVKAAWADAHGEAERRDVARRAVAAFVGDHLGRWAGAFAGALREATTLPYYGALADVLEAWVRAETARLDVAPSLVAGRCPPGPDQDEEGLTCPMASDDSPEALG